MIRDWVQSSAQKRQHFRIAQARKSN